MNEMKKLRLLIPHWIEHNDEHAEEFLRWVEHAGEASPDMLAAVAAVAQVNRALTVALDKLGGPIALQEHLE